VTGSIGPVTMPGVVPLRRPAWTRIGLLAISAGGLVVLCGLSVAFGTRGVGWNDLWAGLGGASDDLAQAAVAKRLPRTVLGVLVGASLGLAGTTMQAITRNPLAEPGLLGVLNGAALAVVVGIAYTGLSGPYAQLAVAVAGSTAAAVFVYTIGSMGRGGATPLKLSLAGAATTAACASLVNAVLLPRIDVMDSFRFWQIGGVGGATWDRITVVAPFLAAGALICTANARSMNSLALGDEIAAGLGADVARARVTSALGAVILCGVATSVAGPIMFVGLIVPHVCRLVIGTDHRWLLPFSALGGAALLVASDIIGRVVARPEELEVGIVTSVVGAPVLVWVAGRLKAREL